MRRVIGRLKMTDVIMILFHFAIFFDIMQNHEILNECTNQERISMYSNLAFLSFWRTKIKINIKN